MIVKEYGAEQRANMRKHGFRSLPTYSPEWDEELRYFMKYTDYPPKCWGSKLEGGAGFYDAGLYARCLYAYRDHRGRRSFNYDCHWALSGAENTRDPNLQRLFLSVLLMRVAAGKRIPLQLHDRLSAVTAKVLSENFVLTPKATNP